MGSNGVTKTGIAPVVPSSKTGEVRQCGVEAVSSVGGFAAPFVLRAGWSRQRWPLEPGGGGMGPMLMVFWVLALPCFPIPIASV